MADRRAGSQSDFDGGDGDLYATRGLVERYHVENKQSHRELGEELIELKDRVKLLEFENAQFKERFNEGAKTMTLHGARLGDLEDGRKPKWSTVGGLALIFLPWIWVVASAWPTLQKFDVMDTKFRDMQTQQRDLQRDIGDIQKSQGAIEKKLDKVLAAP